MINRDLHQLANDYATHKSTINTKEEFKTRYESFIDGYKEGNAQFNNHLSLIYGLLFFQIGLILGVLMILFWNH